MKKLTIRLPDAMIRQIEAEARRRRLSKSAVVRERLAHRPDSRQKCASLDAISDLIGSVKGLPRDLSAKKKKYLRSMRYGA